MNAKLKFLGLLAIIPVFTVALTSNYMASALSSYENPDNHITAQYKQDLICGDKLCSQVPKSKQMSTTVSKPAMMEKGTMKGNMTETMKGNMTETMTANATEKVKMQEKMMEKGNIESPRMQVAHGVAAHDVKCKDGFELVFKSKDGAPACVKSASVQSLIERGWAMAQTMMNQKQ